MGRPNDLIKPLNSTSVSIAIINRTIGLNSFHLRNSHITMLRVLPPAYLHFSPIKAIIRICQHTSTEISPHLLHAITSWISSNFTPNSVKLSNLPKKGIRNQLTHIGCQLRTSKSVMKFSYFRNLSRLLDPRKNSPRNTLVRTKSSDNLVHTPSPSVFLIACMLSILSITSQCWNHLHQTQFRTEFNHLHLWLKSTVISSTKSKKSSTLKSTTDGDAIYCILFTGPDMKTPTMINLGFQPQS